MTPVAPIALRRRFPSFRPPVFGLALGLTPLVLGGCAIDYVDAKGDRHVIGFAAVTIPSAVPVPHIVGACARAGRVRTLGGLAFSNEGGSGLALGWVDQNAVLLETCEDQGGRKDGEAGMVGQ